MRVIANLNERILVALFVLLLKKVHFLAFFKNDFEENINIHVLGAPLLCRLLIICLSFSFNKEEDWNIDLAD